MVRSEGDIKESMGDYYHVCSECSESLDTGAREWCRRSKPVTLGDLEDLKNALLEEIVEWPNGKLGKSG